MLYTCKVEYSQRGTWHWSGIRSLVRRLSPGLGMLAINYSESVSIAYFA